MRIEHHLISIFALLIAFFLLGTGVFLYAATFVPQLHATVVHLIEEDPLIFSRWSLFSLLGGVFLLVLFWSLTKKRYLVVKMGGFTVYQKVYRESVQQFFHNLFPEQATQCDVVIRSAKKLEIFAHVPWIENELREEFLENIEAKLTAHLATLCGWNREFRFYVTFQEVQKNRTCVLDKCTLASSKP